MNKFTSQSLVCISVMTKTHFLVYVVLSILLRMVAYITKNGFLL